MRAIRRLLLEEKSGHRQDGVILAKEGTTAYIGKLSPKSLTSDPYAGNK